MMLAFCACSPQRWAFSPPGSPSETIRPLELTSTETNRRQDVSPPGREEQPIMLASYAEAVATNTRPVTTNASPVATNASPVTTNASPTPVVVPSMLGRSPTPIVVPAYPVTESIYGQPIVVPTYGEEYCSGAVDCPTFSERFSGSVDRGWCDVKCDYRRYYSWPTGRDLLLSVGAAAIMANTSIDQNFRDWVQDDVRSPGSDDFAAFWQTFGEGEIFIPAWAGLALVGSVLDEYPMMGTAGDFG